nr:septation protein imp2 [Cryptococcus depauperatus CBS 7855]
MAQPPEPRRSQSSTSLYKLYNGPKGEIKGQVAEEELQDARLNFCNAFWGTGDKGFNTILTRLRGAGRTVDELKTFWKERAAIEEDYAKRLAKLSRSPLGRDEVGDLADSLQHLLNETAQQSSYHSSLGNEIRNTVENPTSELQSRMTNLKKGLQVAIEKSHKNKGLQEGHVQKAREKYEQDCLKLNSYTAQSSLTQGKELEKLYQKLDRVRHTIPQNEQEFKQFVKVLEVTYGKWEQEWKNFCDHVQDLEEERLAISKDLMWTYANAISQVCVEDDSSCERIREKLEQFEPINDMVNFVKGWGTGDIIPDPPRFINYSAGESYPTQQTYHVAQFTRLSAKPPMPVSSHQPEKTEPDIIPQSEEESQQPARQSSPQPASSVIAGVDAISEGLTRTTLKDEPASVKNMPTATSGSQRATPFGGVALPGMSSAGDDSKQMPPPPAPINMTMPEPRVPSRQGPPSPMKETKEDPMAKALEELRREPPPPQSVRRAGSHIRRPDSVSSAAGSTRGNAYGQGVTSPSPGPSHMTFQQVGPGQSRSPPIDSTLSPPAGGHTAAALAQSMEHFRYQSSRSSDRQRQSVNYANFADDVVGAHPTSRPATPLSPSGSNRAPSPAMMQPPQQPATHIADQVLSQYHQAFPGERNRSRSRAGSVMSNASRNSYNEQHQISPSPMQPREGFVGIGTGNATQNTSSHPPVFRSPDPSPVISSRSLGPQNMGISLTAKGDVAQDTMAEQYRRQYQQQQTGSQQVQAPAPQMASYPGQRASQYGAPSTGSSLAGVPSTTEYRGHDQINSGYGQPVVTSSVMGPPAISNNRPITYGQQVQQPPHTQPYGAQPNQVPQQQYSQAPQPAYNQYPSSPNPQQPVQNYSAPQQPPPQPNYAQKPTPGYQQVNPYARGASPQPQQSPGYPTQQQQPYQPNQSYARAASPAYGYHASPQQSQGFMQQQLSQRTPSPQPNQPPPSIAPTGQWSTNGLPILFYVKALYDYKAETAAEFDFQAGDIIAVTSTPEDGWWSGELLDEARRTPGRTDFPSNLYVLFLLVADFDMKSSCDPFSVTLF